MNVTRISEIEKMIILHIMADQAKMFITLVCRCERAGELDDDELEAVKNNIATGQSIISSIMEVTKEQVQEAFVNSEDDEDKKISLEKLLNEFKSKQN